MNSPFAKQSDLVENQKHTPTLFNRNITVNFTFRISNVLRAVSTVVFVIVFVLSMSVLISRQYYIGCYLWFNPGFGSFVEMDWLYGHIVIGLIAVVSGEFLLSRTKYYKTRQKRHHKTLLLFFFPVIMGVLLTLIVFARMNFAWATPLPPLWLLPWIHFVIGAAVAVVGGVYGLIRQKLDARRSNHITDNGV